jgi:hypothetical protein
MRLHSVQPLEIYLDPPNVFYEDAYSPAIIERIIDFIMRAIKRGH